MSLKSRIRTLFSLEDEYEYEEEDIHVPQTSHNKEQPKNVVSLKAVKSTSKVVLCEPRTFSESQEIADHILNRRAVVINLQRADHAQAKRIIDFLSGTVYAVSGQMQKLGTETFICTPDNIDLSGAISDVEDDFL